MSALRVVILDDEWAARGYLAELVSGSGLGQVVGAFDNSTELEQVLRAGDCCDLALIDIHLEPNPTAGIDLVKRMAGHRPLPYFVFSTAHTEHALAAYDLGVVDYLLKPYSAERVTRCLLRVQDAHRRREELVPERLVARKKRNLVFLEIDRVIAFEAQDRTTVVHAADGTYELDLTLAALSTTFAGRFTRVHRNWLVPLTLVRELVRDDGEISLLLGDRGLSVPVSRDKAQEVKELLLTGPGLRRR